VSACLGGCVVEQDDEFGDEFVDYGEADSALVDDDLSGPGDAEAHHTTYQPDYINPEPQPWAAAGLASDNTSNPEPQPWADDDDDDDPDGNPEPQPWHLSSERDDGEPNPLPWQTAHVESDDDHDAKVK
jgi:hypothetical protein